MDISLNSDDKPTIEKPKLHRKHKRWNKEEKLRYLMFLKIKREIFLVRCVSKETFAQMAKFISTDKVQYECFNLHDRMRQKYGSCDNIIKALKQKLGVDEDDFERETDHKIKEFNEFVKIAEISQNEVVKANKFQCYEMLDNNKKVFGEQQKQKQQNDFSFESCKNSLKVQKFAMKGGQRFQFKIDLPLIVKLQYKKRDEQ